MTELVKYQSVVNDYLEVPGEVTHEGMGDRGSRLENGVSEFTALLKLHVPLFVC